MLPNHDAPHPRRSLLMALVQLRCPRCREGRLFRSMFQMDDPCRICGLLFEREPGYFMGALYFSYGLAMAIAVPLYLLLWAILPKMNLMWIGLICFLLYLPLTPIVFRYARALWLNYDRWGCPSEASTPAGWAEWKSHDHPVEPPQK